VARLLPLICYLTGSSLSAAEVRTLEVIREADDYRLYLDVVLAGMPERVWEVITDYAHLGQLSDRIQTAKVIVEYPDGSVKVKTGIRACVLFMCKDMTQIQRLRKVHEHELVAEIMAEDSDFSAGAARWVLMPAGEEATRMQFYMWFRPDFWVPPLIGPWAIKKDLRADAQALANKIEQRVAQ